jgi:hypothetical protein
VSGNDFPLFGPPSISLAKFRSILSAAGSPETGSAAGIYNAFVAQGVDPAIGLAISQHESSFGKAGIAVGRDNPYGDRYYAPAAAFGGRNVGGWVKFPSYTAAAQYEAHLLATGYRGYTARTFANKYAPAKDHNNPSSYGNSIVNLLKKWSGGSAPLTTKVASGAKPHATAPAHKATTAKKPAASKGGLSKGSLTAYAKAHPKTTAAEGSIAAAILAALL